MSDDARHPGPPEAPLDLEGVPPGVAEDRARVASAVARAAAQVASEGDFASVLAEIVEQSETLGARAAQLFLVEEETLRLVAWRNVPVELAQRMARLPLDSELFTAQAARSGLLQIATESDLAPSHVLTRRLFELTGARSIVAAPLLAQGRVAGVVSWLRALPTRPSAAELEATDSLVTVYAIALENARLRERERKRKELQEAVGHAALLVGESLDLRTVLQTVVDEGRRVVGAEFAALGIIDAENPGGPFRPWVFSGVDEGAVQRVGRLPRPVGLLGAVPLEDRPVRVWDIRNDLRFRGLPPGHPVIVSFLGVPIHFHGRSVGNLYFGNKQGAFGFSDMDEEAARLLATHAGVAMENARIHGQLVEEMARRREAEAARERLLGALEAERHWLREVVVRSPVGILLFDAVGGRLEANGRAEELLGMRLDPALGRHQLVGRAETPEGHVLALEELPCSRALSGEVVPPSESRFLRPDGTYVPLVVRAAPIFDAGGRILGAVEVFEDVSQQKELERMREEWNSVVAHDLRQPLTTIQAFAGTIARTPDAAAQVKQRVDHIRAAARRLDRMIADLLEVSRLESRRLELDLQPADLPTLIRDAVARAAPEMRGHPVRLALDETVGAQLVDAARIEQVLFNLLTNAVKYGAPAPIEVALRRLDGRLEIAVTNEGPPIEPADLPRIFDRFHRTPGAKAGPQAGLGLGLYVSRGLVQAHGGDLLAESGGGRTTFRIRLPPHPAG